MRAERNTRSRQSEDSGRIWSGICLSLLLIAPAFSGCDQSESDDESRGGEATPLMVLDASVAPELNADAEMSVEADTAPPEPVYACEADGFVVNTSYGRSNEYPRFIGIDDRFNGPVKVISVDMVRAQRAGSYDLTGRTPENCEVCVYALYDCGARGCSRQLFAKEGTVVVEEAGEAGGILSGRLVDVFFEEVNPSTGEAIDGGEAFCLQDFAFSAVLPALLGSPVPDFEVQSCATGEMVGLHEIKGESETLWYIGSAGWCPACRQLLNMVFGDFVNEVSRAEVHPIVVLSEDDRQAPVTLEYCQRYAPRYGEAAIEHFYIDPNFEQTFKYIWPYIGANGEFGLPWNALMTGPEPLYYYGDGGNSRFPNIQAALNSL